MSLDDLLSNPAGWGLILGVLTPLLVSAVNQPKYSARTRSLVGLAAAALIGTVTCLAQGQLDAGDLFTTIAAVLAASHVAYKAIYKPTGLAGAVEKATSPRQEDYTTAA